jgi:CheY-like chemotaxis protein
MTTATIRKSISIWVIEDDRIYREVLCGGLRSSLPGTVIREFPTEARVYAELEAAEQGKSDAPDLVICDVMLPYEFPGQNEPVPDEATQRLGEDAFRQAGLRLWQRFRASREPSLKTVPWIYHSVLRRKTMDFDKHRDPQTYYVGKDQPFEELIEVQEGIFTKIDSDWGASDATESSLLQSSATMKQRLLDAFKTPLERCFPVLE